MFTIEKWLPISGFEYTYEVSDLGRVRRIKSGPNTKPGKIIKPRLRGHYVNVCLNEAPIIKVSDIHRLVAVAFIPNPSDLPLVNHKDLNKLNNRADNLEWVTHQGNSDHFWATYIKGSVKRKPMSIENRAQKSEQMRRVWAEKIGKRFHK